MISLCSDFRVTKCSNTRTGKQFFTPISCFALECNLAYKYIFRYWFGSFRSHFIIHKLTSSGNDASCAFEVVKIPTSRDSYPFLKPLKYRIVAPVIHSTLCSPLTFLFIFRTDKLEQSPLCYMKS